MAAETPDRPQAPQIVGLPPEPLGVNIQGARGSDGKGYVLVSFVTLHGTHGVTLDCDRADKIVKALQLAITQGRTGLTIANGHVPT